MPQHPVYDFPGFPICGKHWAPPEAGGPRSGQDRFTEVPRDKRVILVCNAGMRSYEALRQLLTHGIDNGAALQGGIASLKKAGILKLG